MRFHTFFRLAVFIRQVDWCPQLQANDSRMILRAALLRLLYNRGQHTGCWELDFPEPALCSLLTSVGSVDFLSDGKHAMPLSLAINLHSESGSTLALLHFLQNFYQDSTFLLSMFPILQPAPNWCLGFSWFDLIWFDLCVWVFCWHVRPCVTHIPGADRSQKRTLIAWN